MNRRASLAMGLVLVAASLGMAGQGAARQPQEDPAAVVTEGLVSTQTAGTISIKADPVLSDGRLVLRVAAFNNGATPAAFSPTDIKVFVGGQVVPLLSLDQLVAEVGSPAPARPAGSATGYGGQALATGQDGRLDVSGFSGANQTVAGGLSSQVQAQIGGARKLSKADQAQVDGLKAAILQPTEVAPGKAVGGQIVSEKLKFTPGAPREVKMLVRFNSEKHGFIFDAPPAK
jgi:hypothetical protein